MESTQPAPSLADVDDPRSAKSSQPVRTPPAASAGVRLQSRDAALVGTPARSVGFTLSSLGYAVARDFHATLAPLSMEPREFALLRAIAPAEGASQQAIAERLRIPPSRMVAFVDALEERDLVERRPHPRDRRARALHLTEKGRVLLESAFKLASRFESHLCAQLSDAERKQLLDLLQSVGAQLGLDPSIHSAHGD